MAHVEMSQPHGTSVMPNDQWSYEMCWQRSEFVDLLEGIQDFVGMCSS